MAQTDEQIITAKFDFMMFKQMLLDLFDHIKVTQTKPGVFEFTTDRAESIQEKVSDAESQLEKIEGHFEQLTSTLHDQL